MRLLKDHKNAYFNLIQEAGFNVDDFEFKEIIENHDKVPMGWLIKYTPEQDYIFRCDYGLDHFHRSFSNVRFQPGRNKFTEGHNYEGIVPNHPVLFSTWLFAIKHETALDDLWEKKIEINTNAIIHQLNGKQIPNDIKFIEATVKQIQEGVNKLNLSPNVQQQININLSQTINLYQNNLGFDWFGYIIGTITSIIITMAVTPEQGKLLWKLVGGAFTKLLSS